MEAAGKTGQKILAAHFKDACITGTSNCKIYLTMKLALEIFRVQSTYQSDRNCCCKELLQSQIPHSFGPHVLVLENHMP